MSGGFNIMSRAPIKETRAKKIVPIGTIIFDKTREKPKLMGFSLLVIPLITGWCVNALFTIEGR